MLHVGLLYFMFPGNSNSESTPQSQYAEEVYKLLVINENLLLLNLYKSGFDLLLLDGQSVGPTIGRTEWT